MPPPTQQRVFQAIQDKAKRKQDDGGTLTKGVITRYLKDLYDPYLPGRLYFYAQDQDGLPTARVPTYLAGKEHYCSPEPTGFIGKVWPPKLIEDLIVDVDETKDAVRECYVCNKVEQGFRTYYGPKWLTGDGVCGSADCRNPPKSPRALDAPIQDLSEDQATDTDENESLV
ncbi:hypothetical protein G6011_03451 [Alternaria panax]|uniref:Uncharacterized protein n=1 Tax=Alternaria panax TaxID=48097 RepID=A0AAD4NR31_9PLEO|nr:hypothetical protein G6011_03451 [Alternaria panax]